MRKDILTVTADGMLYSGFDQISVQAGMDQAVRRFGLATTEAPIALVPDYRFPPGTEMQIHADGELLLDGYVNSYRPNFTSKTHKVEIEGRSKGQDWVDSSAEHPTSSWKGKTPLQIANEINASGAKITSSVPLDAEEDWNLYQGESGFATVERMLRHQRATQMGLANGDIEIVNGTTATRMVGALVEGSNIIGATGQLMDLARFDDYLVKGQRRIGTGAGNMRVAERFKDKGVKRKRQRVLIHEGDTTADKAKKRARHEAERAMGFSVRAQIIVPGLRDSAGQLWRPNALVWVQSPMLKLAGDMLIESVVWGQQAKASKGGEKGGTVTELGIVHPLAYGGKAGNVGDSDDAWLNF